jgi:D-alanyl-D-alanine carboxypeptidase
MRSFLRRFFVVSILFSAVFSAAAQSGTSAEELALGDILSRDWAATRYQDGKGGLSLFIVTPKGEYFASTVPGATRDSHFRAASVTKTTTAAAIMLLEQRGLLRLDDVITASMPGRPEPYLPDTQGYAIPNKDRITIRLLLQHRAGVFDVSNDVMPATADISYAGASYVGWMGAAEPEHSYTIDELVGVVAKYGLQIAAPGELYHYSNTGYSLLGKIIERVSGKALDAFLMEEFIVPLKMNATSFVTEGKLVTPPEPFIRGWTKAGSEYYDTTEDNASYAHAEGNMVTTFSDLAVWIRALMRGEAGVNPENAARMREGLPTSPGSASKYGLGISDSPPGLGFGHDGGIIGYLTVARYDPAADVTIVVLSSLLDADNMRTVGQVAYGAAFEARKILGY